MEISKYDQRSTRTSKYRRYLTNLGRLLFILEQFKYLKDISK